MQFTENTQGIRSYMDIISVHLHNARFPAMHRYMWRMCAGVVVCAAMLFCALLSGCTKPSYPKENLITDIQEMVFKEYGYKVKVNVVGKTLGVFLPVSQIFSYDMSINDSFAEKSQDIFLSATRVCISTDADIDFFVTTYTDKVKGIEISMIRSVDDTKRLLLGSISRNDYYERTVFKYQFDMDYLAEKTVRKMLEDIPEKGSGASMYFMPGDTFNTSFWFKHLMESELKTDIKYSIIDLKTKQLSEDTVLMYVKARETYTPKPGYEQYTYSFPSGTVHEWMFELRVIRGIVPMIVNSYTYADSRNGTVVKPPMEPPFSDHADLQEWDTYFYFDEVTMTDFIINQVSSKLNRKIREAQDPETKPREDDLERLTQPVNVAQVEAQFVEGENEYTGTPRSFQLIYRFNEGAASAQIGDELHDYSLLVFKRVMEKYSFDDYNELLLLSGDGRLLNSFDKSTIDELELKKFDWKSLFRPSQY